MALSKLHLSQIFFVVISWLDIKLLFQAELTELI